MKNPIQIYADFVLIGCLSTNCRSYNLIFKKLPLQQFFFMLLFIFYFFITKVSSSTDIEEKEPKLQNKTSPWIIITTLRFSLKTKWDQNILTTKKLLINLEFSQFKFETTSTTTTTTSNFKKSNFTWNNCLKKSFWHFLFIVSWKPCTRRLS